VLFVSAQLMLVLMLKTKRVAMSNVRTTTKEVKIKNYAMFLIHSVINAIHQVVCGV